MSDAAFLHPQEWSERMLEALDVLRAVREQLSEEAASQYIQQQDVQEYIRQRRASAETRVMDILYHAGPFLPEGVAARYQAGLLGVPVQPRPAEHGDGDRVVDIGETPHMETEEDAEGRGAALGERVVPPDEP